MCEGASLRSVSVLAHSLGNMVVNSAIGLLPRDTIQSYVMYDAAVPAEAFMSAPFFGPIAQQELHPHTQNLGYADDARWQAEWRKIEQNLCLPEECIESGDLILEEAWNRRLAQLNPQLTPRPHYAKRWTSPESSGPLDPDPNLALPSQHLFGWNGVFAQNMQKTRISNLYNSADRIAAISTTLAPWLRAQTWLKPHTTRLGPFATEVEDTFGQFWAELLDTDAARESALWSLHSSLVPGSPVGSARARRTRRAAELAYWFPSRSEPAAAVGIPGLVGHDAATVGLGILASHSHLHDDDFSRAWTSFTFATTNLGRR